MRPRVPFLVLIVVFAISFGSGTKAVPVPQVRTWRVIGHVDGRTSNLVSTFPVGTPMELIFSFDPATPDADFAATFGDYYDSTPIPGAQLLSVRVGTYTATAAAIRIAVTNNRIFNGQPADAFSLGTETRNAFTLTGPVLPSIGAPRSFSFAVSGGNVPDTTQFQTDALPAAPPNFDLSQVNSNSWGLSFDPTNTVIAQVSGKIDRIETVTYYEPVMGDLSSDGSSPTAFGPLQPGKTIVSAQVGPCTDLLDAFTFDVPSGHFLTGLRATYDSSGGSDMTPFELVRGPVYSVDSVAIALLSAALSNAPHTAGHHDGFDLLASNPAAGPQPPGSYTFRTGVECDALARYSLELIVEEVAVDTTTVLTASSTSAVAGDAVTLTAAVSAAIGTPVGVVRFLDGTTEVAQATLVAGQASTPVTLGVGTHAMRATYDGQDYFVASVSGTVGITVARAPTTTALTVSPLVGVHPGDAVTLTAAVGASVGAPSGTVEFFDGTTLLGTAPVSGGVAALVTGGLAIGPHSFTAAYSGDDRFTSSVSNSMALAVTSAYSFLGFEPPLLADGSAVVKQSASGRTIPVKFRLMLNNAVTTNTVATIEVFKVLNVSTGVVDTTDLTADAGAANENGNRFRIDDGKYVYNLSTAGYSAPGTYRIVVTLGDGSVHWVNFSLK